MTALRGICRPAFRADDGIAWNLSSCLLRDDGIAWNLSSCLALRDEITLKLLSIAKSKSAKEAFNHGTI